MKEDYDGAEPTASSVSVLNLLQLSHLVDDRAWPDRIERTLRLFGSRLEQMGRAVPMMAAALSTHSAGLQQVVIVDERDASDARPDGAGDLDRVVSRRYLPFAIVLHVDAARRAALAERLPLVTAMQPVDGQATAYVCRDFTCRQPVTTAAALEQELETSR
jgi:uncharacterized protein YyaL (SSP411 family)